MAIKIIQNGDLNRLYRTIEFTCNACGCVFEADKEDYTYQYSQREDYGWYEIKCPCCDKWVTKKDTKRWSHIKGGKEWIDVN